MPIMWKLSGHWISPWAAWISTPCSATLWRRSTNYRKLVLGSVPISPAVLNPFWPNWKSPFAAVSTRQRPTAWCRVTAPKTVKHPWDGERNQVLLLQQRRLVEQAAVSETVEAQQTGIHQIALAVQDQVRQDAAGGGGAHDTVAAESVGQEKARNLLHTADHRDQHASAQGRFEARGLFGIVPRQHQSAAFGAVMKAGAHVVHHGR